MGSDSVADLAPLRMERTLSGVISDAPSFTLAEAVILVGLPFMVMSLSKRTERVYARFCGGISSSFLCMRFRLSATMEDSLLDTAFRYSCSVISSL